MTASTRSISTRICRPYRYSLDCLGATAEDRGKKEKAAHDIVFDGCLDDLYTRAP